jgi:hypothetical protein
LLSSSILALDSLVSLISSFISSLNPFKSNFLPLNCSINSSVNSGLTALSNFFIVTLNLVFLLAKSAL